MYTNLGEKNPKVHQVLSYSVLLYSELRVQCLMYEPQTFSFSSASKELGLNI